jgi:hypothetical protein
VFAVIEIGDNPELLFGNPVETVNQPDPLETLQVGKTVGVFGGKNNPAFRVIGKAGLDRSSLLFPELGMNNPDRI